MNCLPFAIAELASAAYLPAHVKRYSKFVTVHPFFYDFKMPIYIKVCIWVFEEDNKTM